MATRIQFIKSPSKGTIGLLRNRMSTEGWERIQSIDWDSLLLIQDALPLLFLFADKAEKAAEVVVEEVRGSCPQHISTIAIFGKTAAVEAARDAVNEALQ